MNELSPFQAFADQPHKVFDDLGEHAADAALEAAFAETLPFAQEVADRRWLEPRQ